MEVEKIVLERELLYRGTVLLTYRIEYPKLVGITYGYGIDQVNRYNRRKALSLKLYAERDLWKDAKEVYDYNMANGYPIIPYELVYTYDITLLDKGILSLYTDEYVFTGGAHGSTTRESQNWNLQRGIQFSLESVFPHDPDYFLLLLKEINHQIANQEEEDPGRYFENYCQLVLDTFRLDQFYLTESDVVIFFQQYDIAPYSSGIPTFSIPR